ncbi:MAG: transcription antitermination factor NusB, partial [Acidimicrobiales bacterium]
MTRVGASLAGGGGHRGPRAGGSRREARERALSLLYEAEAKGISPTELLGQLPVAPDPFAAQLLAGVEADRARIDGIVAGAAIGWTVERMPVVDRNICRLAVFELTGRPDIPAAVVISEA